MTIKYSTLSRTQQKGFALVVTVSLMVLLSVIALGFLSLSAVALRSGSHEQAQMEAQANARVALQIAIGELQKYTGADTRITAPADILDPAHPPLTGVWKSWEGSNHQQPSGTLPGRPTIPDYSSKKKPGSNGGRFLTWLISGAREGMNITDPSSLAWTNLKGGSVPPDEFVPLVSEGTVGKEQDKLDDAPGKYGVEVFVQPQMLENDSGGYAWWVSGENQKARLPKPYNPPADTPVAWADLNRSHAITDPAVFSLDSLLADPVLAQKTFTRNTADLYAKAGATLPSQSFHDLSATSVGLLTNTATGGWRKDFSLLTENWDAQPTSGLEFFKISPTAHLSYTRPASNFDPRPPNSMLYHWADYRASTLREFWARRGPIASWAKIKSYATLYKKMSSTTNSAPNIDHQSWPDRGEDFTQPNATLTYHDIRLMPQMARVQMVASHYATATGAAAGKLRPAVLYTPVVTLWNPYSTRLTLNGRLIISPQNTWPLALKHRLGGVALTDEYWAVQYGSSLPEYRSKSIGWVTSNANQDYSIRINQNPNTAIMEPIILEPGETRIFSPAAGSLQNVTSNRAPQINLFPGVRTGVGIFYTLDRRITGAGSVWPFDLNVVSLPGATTIEADAKFDVPSVYNFRTGGLHVCGSAYQWFVDTVGSGWSHSWFQIFYSRSDADTLYPPKLGLASTTLAECSVRPVPFLSMTLGSRIANHRAIPTKGLVQADPVVDFFSSNGEPRFTDAYPGNDTLVNTPWDFSFVEHASAADDMLPNVDNTTNSSYIVTGVRKADGVSRIIASELPTRPLASLADLTHMQIRALNPTPPYSGNNVANSDASPLIPKDNIVNPANTRANARNNEQQDDSYCANHVLFDDWFFSSIAPKPSGFGPSGGTDLRQTYLDFLTGKEPLINRAYHPIAEDRATDETMAAATFTEHVEPTESWKSIASRLEVEGMFNVNSTSVRAWRALLGHARNQKIPYTQPGGTISLTNPTDYAFSRTSVAGDRAAGEPPQVAGEYADTTEFTGHRVFTDDMLNKLAENIVAQVRARGPFLSLSEFVNRQLSQDNSLALAGAIQTALNQLAADSSLNPFQTIQDESTPSVADPPGPEGYVFRDAAIGHNTYGLPGWTRQADVLRPLAPILSARDDTFTIRAYGDSRSPDGRILARAWCEATVQRTRDFVDSADSPEITTQPTAPANQTFGRRFKVLSFRWLNASEV
jgi:type II secretory pathway pseudopilin PulG